MDGGEIKQENMLDMMITVIMYKKYKETVGG